MVPIYKIIQVYEYMYQRTYMQPDYAMARTGRNLKLLSKFQKMIPVDAGNDFIWNYTVHAFWCYDGKLSRRNVELNWIYGQRMVGRYRNRTEDQIYRLQQYKESKAIKNPLKEGYELSLSDAYKDKQRKKYWNTPRGYLNCLDFGGFLYDEKNVYCKNCRYKKHCDVKSE